MVLTALLLVTLAVVLCGIGIRFTLAALGLGGVQTLLWLGVAEVPAPPDRRRRGA